MKKTKASIINYLLIITSVTLLSACGGGGGGKKATTPKLPAPKNVTATAGVQQVTLKWDAVTDATGYDICQATAITTPANCTSNTNGTLIAGSTSPKVITKLAGNTKYFYVVIPKNTKGAGTPSKIVNATTLPLPAPKNVTATAGVEQVTLKWDAVADATAYDICQATATITTPANCASNTNGTLIADSTSPKVITSLTKNTKYFFVVIPKNAQGDGTASVVVNATPTGTIDPSPTGKLNDTGIIKCGDYAFGSSASHQNNLDCSQVADNEGDPIPKGQDGHFGRDVTAATNSDADGHKGFSYIKIDDKGFALTDQSAAAFNCVKDKVTGLIWEIKQTEAGLHNKDDKYTWLNTDSNTNGGTNGEPNLSGSCEGKMNNTCNTQAYVARVNNATLCGANDWRLPTKDELISLTNLSRSNPAIDSNYFPKTQSSNFWSSSPYAPFSALAWDVNFVNGYVNALNKSNDKYVRLVRSGQ